MELNNLEFKISNKIVLTDKEIDNLTEAYRKLYLKIYNFDLFDSFALILKKDIQSIIYKNKDLNYLAENYNRAKDTINSLNKRNINKILIYYNNELIGIGRIKTNNYKVHILDIAINGVKKEIERDIWEETVIFIEDFYKKKKYKKIYVEVPLKDGALFMRASKLGFKEDYNDISEDRLTYLLNKVMRNNDVK